MGKRSLQTRMGLTAEGIAGYFDLVRMLQLAVAGMLLLACRCLHVVAGMSLLVAEESHGVTAHAVTCSKRFACSTKVRCATSN